MRRGTIAATALGALALAGCATGTSDAGADATGDAMEPKPSATASGDAMEAKPTASSGGDAMAEVDPAFAFTAPMVSGDGDFEGASIADKDVILWFWAPWCPTCEAEAPVLLDAAERLPEGVEVVGIAGLSGDQAFMQEFVDKTKTQSLTQIADLDGSIWQGFGVSSQATIVVIDDTGETVTLGAGVTADELVDYAEQIAAT